MKKIGDLTYKKKVMLIIYLLLIMLALMLVAFSDNEPTVTYYCGGVDGNVTHKSFKISDTVEIYNWRVQNCNSVTPMYITNETNISDLLINHGR